MATIRKKREKWCVEIRRSFHKHISKTFTTKQESKNVRWTRLVRLVHGPSIEVPESFWNSN